MINMKQASTEHGISIERVFAVPNDNGVGQDTLMMMIVAINSPMD